MNRFLCFVMLLVGLSACAAPNADLPSDTAPAAADAETPSDFTLEALNGGEITLSELQGQFVLVNFWATWCIPCRAEMPYLEEISVDHSDDLIVLGINMGEDKSRVGPFIDEMGLTFPILLDPPSELIREHEVRGLPVSFVVAPDGTIAYRRVGEILPEEFDLWLADNLER